DLPRRLGLERLPHPADRARPRVRHHGHGRRLPIGGGVLDELRHPVRLLLPGVVAGAAVLRRPAKAVRRRSHRGGGQVTVFFENRVLLLTTPGTSYSAYLGEDD